VKANLCIFFNFFFI